MISRIGIIFQGANDKGFLMGLRDRLGCRAELIEHKPNRGKNPITKWREGGRIWKDFQQRGVQLVVRLTDAGTARWQAVKKEEVDNFPEEMRAIFVCGVVPGAVERWLALDRQYLEAQLKIPANEGVSDDEMIGRVKGAMGRIAGLSGYDEAVRGFVARAPQEVFRRWLEEPSFKDFYGDCRNAAIQEHDCPVKDELRSSPEP